MKYQYIILIFSFLIFSCKKENTTATFTEDPTIIQDQFGRQLILHGLNTSSSAKSEPLRNPWILENDVEREATELGFNFVRYLIFWDAIEPQKDNFDVAYLDRVEPVSVSYTHLDVYKRQGLHQP